MGGPPVLGEVMRRDGTQASAHTREKNMQKQKNIPKSKELKQSVAKRVAAGESGASIARGLGTNRWFVNRLIKQQDVQDMVAAEGQRLLSLLPDAVDNYADLVVGMKKLPKKDHKARELSYKASTKVLEAGGVLPGQQSVAIQSFNQTNIISPGVMNILQTILAAKLNAPVEQDSPLDSVE